MYPVFRGFVPVLATAVALLAHGDLGGQVLIKKDQPDSTLTPEQRKEVLDGVLKQLDDHYIFPDKAREMEKSMRARQEKKEYDSITSAKTFAETLTKQDRKSVV